MVIAHIPYLHPMQVDDVYKKTSEWAQRTKEISDTKTKSA